MSGNWERGVCAVVICLFIVNSAFAQNGGYKFHSLTVSSGESTITSGITGIAQFTKDKRLIEVTVQQEQAWFVYGRKFESSKKFSSLVSGSVGQFRGAPWAGPLLTLEMPIAKIAGQQVAASIMQWPWLFVKRPRGWENTRPNSHFLPGYLGGVQLTIGPIGLAYSKEKFLDNPWNELPALSYTKGISKEFHISASATWNNNDRHWMYYLGLTWKPTK